ncbi:MAG: rhamnan synthesis F family protein [Pseudomonadota bacterium]
MKKLPAWKLKRELARLAGHSLRVVPDTWEYLTLTRRYDRDVSKDQKLHQGEKSLSAEVAIYLIFPSDGVLTSHLQMLDALNSHDIAPVIVSNQWLSPTDLETLKQQCALVIERPNVGYDFGGYRDAVLTLEEHLHELERLYILNDSVWMIDSEKSWFQQVREADKDFCGATSNYGIKRYSEADFRDIVWEYTPAHKNFHYASYAIAVGQRILRDPTFLAHWKGFKLSNDKKRTVRRGEIGLSKWVLDRHYSHAATCDVQDLDKELAKLAPDEIEDVTKNLIIPEKPRLLKKRNEVLQTDPLSEDGISDRNKVILTAVSLQAMGYAMPYYTIKYRHFQFIKKSPLWLSRDSSDITLRILESLDGPLGRQACLEAHQIVKQRPPESSPV